jgi:hypothetical protein
MRRVGSTVHGPMWRTLRWILFGVAAAGAVGVVARVFMRLVALSVGDGEFTMMGSVFIVLIYVVAMAPLAVAAALTQRWWRWVFGAGGSVFLLFPAIGVAGEEIGHVGDVPWWRWVWLVAASIGVFATLLAAPLATVWAVDRQRRTSEVEVEVVTA